MRGRTGAGAGGAGPRGLRVVERPRPRAGYRAEGREESEITAIDIQWSAAVRLRTAKARMSAGRPPERLRGDGRVPPCRPAGGASEA